MRSESFVEGRKEPVPVVDYVEAGNNGRGRVGARTSVPVGVGDGIREDGDSLEMWSSISPRRSSASASVNANRTVNATTDANANVDANYSANANANANASANANAKASSNTTPNGNANIKLSTVFRAYSEHLDETHTGGNASGPVGRWVEDGGSYYKDSDAIAGGTNHQERDDADADPRSEAGLNCIERAMPPGKEDRLQERREAWQEGSMAVVGRGNYLGPVGQTGWAWTPRSTRQAALLMRGAVRFVKCRSAQ